MQSQKRPLPNSRRRRVCLFGTSANPPTGWSGHTGILQALANRDDVDEVRVIPVYQHMFSSKRNQLLEYHHRMEMCRLGWEGKISKVVISNQEETVFHHHFHTQNSSSASNLRVGTAELLEFLQEQEPETEFSFCLGADTFLDLTTWKWRRSKDVLRLLEGRLLVLHRQGISTANASSHDSTEALLQDRVNQINQTVDGQGNIQLLEIPSLSEVSSSEVRSTKDEDKLSQLLLPEVLQYIKTNHFYAFENDTGSRKDR